MSYVLTPTRMAGEYVLRQPRPQKTRALLPDDLGGAPPRNTAPVLTSAPAKTVWNTSTSPKSTSVGGTGAGSVSWNNGDRVYVIAIGADQSGFSFNTPSTGGANLGPFAPIAGPVTTASACRGQAWMAIATGIGSGTISLTTNGVQVWGMIAWPFSGSEGIGGIAALASTALTASLARADDHSFVLEVLADWGAGTPGAPSGWTPAGATSPAREDTKYGTDYTVYANDWGDQGAAGTTNYGVTVTASGANYTKIALEVYGSYSAGAAAIGLTPCSITLQAQPITPVPQPVSVSLSPAVLTISPTSLSPVPQPVVIALSPVSLTLSATALSPVPGQVTTSISPASLTLSGVSLNLVPQLVTISLSPATLTFSAVVVTPAAPGQSVVNLTLVAVTLQARSLTPVPQPVTVVLTPVALALSAQSVGPVPQPITVGLGSAAVSLVCVPVAPVPQPVAVALVAAAMALQPRAVSPVPQPITVAIVSAAIAFQSRPLIPVPQPVVIDLIPVVLLLAAIALAPSGEYRDISIHLLRILERATVQVGSRITLKALERAQVFVRRPE